MGIDGGTALSTFCTGHPLNCTAEYLGVTYLYGGCVTPHRTTLEGFEALRIGVV